jgi:NADH:ubiquinone oxidoreductase subunit 2 (subunit N)
MTIFGTKFLSHWTPTTTNHPSCQRQVASDMKLYMTQCGHVVTLVVTNVCDCNVLIVITFIGTMTSFFATTTGILHNDLKRVITYSTCGQLGYMIFTCGISNYFVSIFHLKNHAFFLSITLFEYRFSDSCHVT